MQVQWNAVDNYIVEKLVEEDAGLVGALEANRAAGLPAIDVSAAQGKFLHLLVRMSSARRVLEIGTLGGYSTIWMAKALPSDGLIVTLEQDARHAAVAQRNVARAGLADRIDIRVGRAAETLPALAAENPAPFDFVFIDADKPGNAVYLDWAVRLGRGGTVIVLDNVVRDGRLADPDSRDPGVVGSRSAFDLIAGHPRLSATALQTVGSKGWDGFLLALVGHGAE